MTEQEASEWAAKLTRIWMPSGSFGEGASWTLQNGEFKYTAHLTDEVTMWFGSSELCRGFGYHLQCTRDGQITDFFYCSEKATSVVRASEPVLPLDERQARFSDWYLLLMRSRCWLSGCPIEASQEERERWTDWQRAREEEGRGEPTNTVEWEVRRVAAALGVDEITVQRNPSIVHYEGWVGDVQVTWELGDPNARVKNIFAGSRSYCGVFRENGRWQWEPGREGHEQMARALYCLGIEDKHILEQLDYQLTAHEKMELHHSFPREFWPSSWVIQDVAANP